jgi:DNA-binding response OmpR family regulator
MPYTILCVEDEPRIVELLQAVLEHPDIHLLAAYSCTDGLKLARLQKPDLLMLDVIMPDNDGWWVYMHVRADVELSEMPIIMLTGILHRYRIVKEFASSPIDAYITKPFEAGVVRKAVQEMLGCMFWSSLNGKPILAEPADKARLA